ncbi:MAG: efflux RND transporter periplasmic adaptor subunit, partial [Alistipes sp.]|nr:efflux RND transporter periplasmic adaptor subunit [Candidatus Minthomonas equi]
TEVKISPAVSGEIVELNVEEGDRVSKGELLIQIQQDVYLSAKERAEASLQAARAQCEQQGASFKKAELSFLRNEKLIGMKAISESEFEVSKAEYLVAKGQLAAAEFNVRSAEASLKEAQENLVKTTIYAPMDGIVSKLSVEKGERVVGTSQMAGTEMLRIADMDMMEVVVDVNENDIIRISENDTASISVDAYPGRTFTGIVTKIASSAKNIGATTDQVTNFEVKVAILQQSYADLCEIGKLPFRPGMSASVSIRTECRQGILTIPLQCVTARNGVGDGSSITGEYVFVVCDSASTVKAVPVRTGIQDIENIEVLEGLSESDRIVTGPYLVVSKTLKEGDKVMESQEKEK